MNIHTLALFVRNPTQDSFDDIPQHRKIMSADEFEVLRKIGVGGFGRVDLV